MFLTALLAQLFLVKHLPALARTCDLLLLFLVALALARPLAFSLLYALAAGMVVDSLSFNYPLFHTCYYAGVVAFLAWRPPYRYLTHTPLFMLVVGAALAAKVVVAYVWTGLFVYPVAPVLLVRISWPGVLLALTLAQLVGRRLLLTLKEPEVLDYDVER